MRCLAYLTILAAGCLSGGTLAHGKLYDRDATATTAARATDGSWPKLPARVEGLAIAPHSRWGDVSVGWSDGQLTHYVLRSEAKGPYALHARGASMILDGAEAHVVALGLDLPQAVDFIIDAREVQIVKGVEPAKALDDAVARWKRYLVDEQDALTAALDKADHRSGGRPLGPEASSSIDGFMPTWMPGDRRFVIVFTRSTTRTSTMTERIKSGGCHKYDNYFKLDSFPGDTGVQVACPQMPDYEERTHVRAYSANLALVLEYDAGGTLSAQRRYGPDPHPTKGPF